MKMWWLEISTYFLVHIIWKFPPLQNLMSDARCLDVDACLSAPIDDSRVYYPKTSKKCQQRTTDLKFLQRKVRLKIFHIYISWSSCADNLAESHPNPIIPGGEWHRGEGAVAVRAGGTGGRHPTPRDADEVCEEVERPLALEQRRLFLQPHLGPRWHLGSKKDHFTLGRTI